VIVIEANTQGKSLADVNAGIQASIAGMAMPSGYKFSSGGEVRDQQKVFSKMLAAMGIAVLLMYLVLVGAVRFIPRAMAIMASLPLSLIGVVLALWMTGNTFNIMSMIGVLMLMGIVAKNAILPHRLRQVGSRGRQGPALPLIEAAACVAPDHDDHHRVDCRHDSGGARTRRGADFRAPAGHRHHRRVITSTVLTLVVIPTVYEILDGWRETMASSSRSRNVQDRRVHRAEGRAGVSRALDRRKKKEDRTQNGERRRLALPSCFRPSRAATGLRSARRVIGLVRGEPGALRCRKDGVDGGAKRFALRADAIGGRLRGFEDRLHFIVRLAGLHRGVGRVHRGLHRVEVGLVGQLERHDEDFDRGFLRSGQLEAVWQCRARSVTIAAAAGAPANGIPPMNGGRPCSPNGSPGDPATR